MEQHQQRHLERRFDTPDPVDLVVELRAGAVQADAADTTAATVSVDGPRAGDFTVALNGRTLTVIAPRPRGFFADDEHTVTVLVPRSSTLSSRTGSASAEATGAWGRVHARSGSGQVGVEAAEGPVVVDSGSGDVRCDRAGGDLRVKTGSGTVEIGAVDGTAAVSTGSGDVLVGVSGSRLVVKTGSGSVRVRQAHDDVSVTTGSGTLALGSARRGSVRAKTGSGEIQVGVPAGTPTWTDITSASGRIRSDLAPVGKPATGQDHLELRLRSGSGDIVLGQVPA